MYSSTISGNLAHPSYLGGGMLIIAGDAKLRSTTVTLNSPSGVTAYASNGATRVSNTIIAANGSTAQDQDVVGHFLSQGYNLIGLCSGAGAFNGVNDQTGVLDPMLAALADNGGPTLTHAILLGSSAIDGGSTLGNLLFDQRLLPYTRNAGARADVGAFELQTPMDTPFPAQLVVSTVEDERDSNYQVGDLSLREAEIAAGTHNSTFDLNNDGLVNLADRDLWLVEAGANNLASGNTYVLGDANLDGVVDGQDFVIWNTHKFTSGAGWCGGDFNADGIIDGQDFVIWNNNKFTTSDYGGLAPPVSVGFVASWSRSHNEWIENKKTEHNNRSDWPAATFGPKKGGQEHWGQSHTRTIKIRERLEA